MDNEVLRRRWASLPSSLTAVFAPFGEIDGLLDWRFIPIGTEGVSLSLNARDVDLTGASLAGANIQLNLENSVLADVSVTDAEIVGAQLANCTLVNVSLRDASLSHARIVGSMIDGLDIRGSQLDATSFTGCQIKGFRLSGSSSGEKLKFVDSTVDLELSHRGQGNFTLLNCRGRVAFTERAVPHRLFNRSDAVEYYCLTGTREVRLPIPGQSVVMAREECAEWLRAN